MPFPSNSDAISRKQLADAIDAYDAEIKTLNEGKSDTYKSYREQLEATGMDGRRASAELAATKAAIARRRKLTEDPTKVREKDDLTDEILDEILPSLARAREERPASTTPIASKSGAEKAKTAETSTTTSAIAADPAEGAEPPSPQQASSADQSRTDDNDASTQGIAAGLVTSLAGVEVDADRQPIPEPAADEAQQVPPTDGQTGGGAATAGGEPTPVVPAVRPTAADNARSIRPWCLNADDLSKCAGQGRKHCHGCLKAHADAEGLSA